MSGDKTVREEVVDYILNWPAERETEIELMHRILEELNSNERLLKDMAHKAGVWQGKYTECKKEITVLRQRKNFYKKIVVKSLFNTCCG